MTRLSNEHQRTLVNSPPEPCRQTCWAKAAVQIVTFDRPFMAGSGRLFLFRRVLKITAISVVPIFSGDVLLVYAASGFFPKLPSAEILAYDFFRFVR